MQTSLAGQRVSMTPRVQTGNTHAEKGSVLCYIQLCRSFLVLLLVTVVCVVRVCHFLQSKQFESGGCMLIHSRRHISHMRVLSWHKQLYSYQGSFTWQLDLARFMWPVPGVQLWVDLKDASVKTDLFWCLVNIGALLCGCCVCCLDFLYLCMSYDSGIWVRRTKTSVNINISSAVLYFWSVLTALSFSHSSPLWGWTCFITRSSSIINSGVLVLVGHIQTRLKVHWGKLRIIQVLYLMIHRLWPVFGGDVCLQGHLVSITGIADISCNRERTQSCFHINLV